MKSTTVTITGIPIAPGNIAVIAGQASSECEHLVDPCGDGDHATLGQMDYPVAVAVDGQGNVCISDYYDNRIRCVNNQVGGCNDLTGKPVGTIFTYAGTGDAGWNMTKAQTPIPANAAKLDKPYQLAVQGLDGPYLADSLNDEIGWSGRIRWRVRSEFPSKVISIGLRSITLPDARATVEQRGRL